MKTPPAASNFTHFDIIGDIHGQFDMLEALLASLGYERTRESWRHPDRMALFLGDYIDRGPKVRETLHLVKNMVDYGNAFALMGNHEFNAIGFHTKDAVGHPLREHSAKNIHQHQATLDDFAGHESELATFIEWMKELPLFLDFKSLRTVHACWCEKSIRLLNGASLKDPDFLLKANTKGTPEFDAVETILKGPEIPVPEGITFTDKDGTTRDSFRVTWWGHYGDPQPLFTIALPPYVTESCELVDPEVLKSVPNYPMDTIPVFFGHYWLAPTWGNAELGTGLCCLDFSAGNGGRLVAYRWDGEQTLDTFYRCFSVTPDLSINTPPTLVNEQKPQADPKRVLTEREIYANLPKAENKSVLEPDYPPERFPDGYQPPAFSDSEMNQQIRWESDQS